MAIFNKKTKDDTKDEVNGKAKEGGPQGKAAGKAKKAVGQAPKKESMKDLYSDTKAKKIVAKKDKDGKAVAEAKKNSIKREAIAYRTLVRPLIAEKAANMGPENKYVFAVTPNANKVEIAKAIEEVYGIKPVAVNVINVLGKKVRQGKTVGKRKDWRKAVITLPKGKTINIYEGV